LIVVDTNVIAYLLIPGGRTADARNVFLKDAHWAAPVLWRSEFRNILALYMRREYLSLKYAREFINEAEALMESGEYAVESNSVLQLITQSSCSAYDCEFVALAQSLDVPLVTADQKIVKNFPATAVALDYYT